MTRNQLMTGEDCTMQFREAYQNRYTWGEDFSGYKGLCSWTCDQKTIEGCFLVRKDLKSFVQDIDDDVVRKSIEAQLWEVGIHRVRRPFEQTHGENTFYVGDSNDIGMEVLVGGKNSGDKYRIKNNVVTMVYRHIHGSLILIYTDKIVDTGNGYLSKLYSSQYLDPSSGKPIKAKRIFNDEFIPLYLGGPWVLKSRRIEKESSHDSPAKIENYNFTNLEEVG